MNVTRSIFKRFKASSCHTFHRLKETNYRQHLQIRRKMNTKSFLPSLTARNPVSDEMAFMCAKLPIYHIKKTTPFSVMIKRKCYHLLANYQMCVKDSKVIFT